MQSCAARGPVARGTKRGGAPASVALLPAYGERGSELLAWVGEILVADGAAASHFEGSVETLGALLDSIGQVGAVIREHPHASTYASLGRIIDLPGYYLDATPCTVCSSPAPLPTKPVCREAPASSAGAADSERVPARRASSASSRMKALLGGSALQLTSSARLKLAAKRALHQPRAPRPLAEASHPVLRVVL